MKYLPIFYRVAGQSCLVVGAGSIAARKAELLLKAGAEVVLVAPDIGNSVMDMSANPSLQIQQRKFQDSDIEGQLCIIAATDNSGVNQRVSKLAKQQNIPVNVVDNPDLCSFIMPSIIDRDPIQIAISTGGTSPVLARMLRAKLESWIPGAYGELAKLAQKYRPRVIKNYGDVDSRRRFWEQTLDGPVAELVFSGRNDQARKLLEINLNQPKLVAKGEVYLVGAGPGDPDLLTFKALRLMQKADVVVYDKLVSEPILDMVRRDAEKIYAGKASARSNSSCSNASNSAMGKQNVSQENINQMLVRLAKQGKRVLRLKGGDPFIFGRGGEEIVELMEQGVDFEVVPGITAASGCASYAGIPLTHRDLSQACIFVTGHRSESSDDLNWKMLSHANQTVVFYMGLDNVSRICSRLIEHGRAATTPAALIEKGTTSVQRVFISDLTNLATIIAENHVKAPTLIIVGEVVKLHSKLGWYKSGEEIGPK